MPDVPEGSIRHRFHAGASNALWFTGMTEFGLPRGKCHLSPMLGCFGDRFVVRGYEVEVVNRGCSPYTRTNPRTNIQFSIPI